MQLQNHIKWIGHQPRVMYSSKSRDTATIPVPFSVTPWTRPCQALILGLALLFSDSANTAELAINGVGPDIAENIRLTVGTIPDFPEELSARVTQSVSEQAQDALAAIGYFSAKVDSRYTRDDTGQRISLDIQPNDPVRVRTVLPLILGPAREDGDYMPVLGRLPLRRNAIFNSGDYESAKNILIDAAQDRGYFDFEFLESSVKVSRQTLSADITLKAQSGVRYTFGEISFDQEIFSDEFLSRWLVFREGDPFESSQLAEFTKGLQNSGYFKSVRVIPQRDVQYGTTVPVVVKLIATDKNHVGVGIGYSTDTELRTKLTWSKPRINKRGHSADVDLRLSGVKQNVSFAYRIPRRQNPLDNYWGFEIGLQKEQVTDDTESALSSWQVQRVRKFSSDWQESVFLRWERERTTISGEDEDTDLLLPGVAYSRVRSEGNPFITKGHSTSFKLMYGSREAFSTIDFLKGTFNFKYIKEVVEDNTLILALQYGALRSNDYDRVPLSQKFFAGGDRSVRGYAYGDLSPLDFSDEVRVGGRYLEVMSLEYNYRFRTLWSAAAFVDVGRAFNTFDTRYSTGAGVGIRWQSPVGPFRLDVAMPIDDDEFDSPRLHLSLGPDL